jgi:hypothetical protein
MEDVSSAALSPDGRTLVLRGLTTRKHASTLVVIVEGSPPFASPPVHFTTSVRGGLVRRPGNAPFLPGRIETRRLS